MRNPFTRAFGYLIEGGTGLVGLAGAGQVSRDITPLLFRFSGVSLEELQQGTNMFFSILISCVTLWRMFKPKRLLITPTDGSTITPAVVVTPPPVIEPINPVLPPPNFKEDVDRRYSEPEQ